MSKKHLGGFMIKSPRNCIIVSVLTLLTLFFSTTIYTSAENDSSGSEKKAAPTKPLFSSYDEGSAGLSISEHFYFLGIADMHVDTGRETKPMEIDPSSIETGTPRKNDADEKTFNKMLGTIKNAISTRRMIKKPDFIIVLGDLASHNRCKELAPDDLKKLSIDAVKEHLKNCQKITYATEIKNNEDIIKRNVTEISRDEETVFKTLGETFKDIPIFYVFGNNDGLRLVEGPFKDDTINDLKGPDLPESPYEIATKKGGWKNGFLSTGLICGDPLLVPCIDPIDIKDDDNSGSTTFGYYSAHLKPKLKLVAINSMLFSANPKNKAPEDQADKQLAWLEKQLASAHDKKESVIIATHIPFGKNVFDKGRKYLKEPYQTKLNDLVVKYSKNITGIICGHVHYEELKIMESQKGLEEIIISIPAMSTAEGNAPGIKEFHLTKGAFPYLSEAGPWKIDNYQTLSFVKEEGLLTLNRLYNFKDYYCPNNKIDDIKELDICNLDAPIETKIAEQYTMGNPHLDEKKLNPVIGGVFIEIQEKVKEGFRKLGTFFAKIQFSSLLDTLATFYS